MSGEKGRREPPTRVFWEKRLQTIENKGSECRKERKETTKRLQVSENMGFATEAPNRRVTRRGRYHPRGDGKYAQCAENGGDIGVT
jgi:hypothetical protein